MRKSRRRSATDENGKPVFVMESWNVREEHDLEGNVTEIRSLSTMNASDGEVLTPEGDDWFRAIHTNRRFRLTDH